MPASSDEHFADLCDRVWEQVRDIDPPELLTVLLVVTAEVIAANDAPEPCLAYACDTLAKMVRHFPEVAEKARRAHLRLVPKEGV